MAGALAPLDLTGHLLLQIAGSAQALAVVDAGLPASRDGTDVVGLADHRIAVRATADGVPPRQEARHRLGEGARLRFHCYQLSGGRMGVEAAEDSTQVRPIRSDRDRKSTRLNSSHVAISYAVFCLKQKTEAMPAPR